jgi:hypothetical protein
LKRLAINVAPPAIAGGLGWALSGNPLLGLTLLAATAIGKLFAAWRCRPREVRL